MRTWPLCLRILPGFLFLAGTMFASTPAAAAADSGVPMSTGGVTQSTAPDLMPTPASRAQLKQAHLLRLDPTTRQVVTLAPGSAEANALEASAAAYTSYQLFADYSAHFLEPQGDSEKDDARTSYTDHNYWNFCSAGAATVAVYYEGAASPTPPLQMKGTYWEPGYSVFRRGTYWNTTDSDYRGGYLTYARAYIMYVAEVTQPQNPLSANFVRGSAGQVAGLDDFRAYPTTGTANVYIIRDELNWETSAHNGYGNWVGYFWVSVTPSDGSTYYSRSMLHSDVVADVVSDGVPVVVTLNAQYLVYNSSTGYGNWGTPSGPLGHAIAIIGYDDTKGTYSYVDTCSAACSGGPASLNGKVHTILQSTMWSAIANWKTGWTW